MFKSLALGIACAAVVCGATAGCGTSLDVSEHEGALSLPLQFDGLAGVPYRLSGAKFDLVDSSGNHVGTLQPAPDARTLSVPLAQGQYSLVLRDGWVLQRRAAEKWADVPATLAGEPQLDFAVKSGAVTDLSYEFSAGLSVPALEGARTFANRRAFAALDRESGVNECGLYVGRISSLAAFTIDCLGRLDGTQFRLVDGALERTFSTCSSGDETALGSIDGILSLQYDRPEFEAQYPEATKAVLTNKAFSSRCVAQEWSRWSARFGQGGGSVCPNWRRISATTPSIANVKVDANPLVSQKIDFEYEVSFPPGSPAASCGTAAECATACAGGFKGFVLSTNGTDRVTADPSYWESDTAYNRGSNPYLAPGYYHNMALYGPYPGDQFGHWQRARAFMDRFGRWYGEECTLYLGSVVYHTRLIYVPGRGGAVSWCTPS